MSSIILDTWCSKYNGFPPHTCTPAVSYLSLTRRNADGSIVVWSDNLRCVQSAESYLIIRVANINLQSIVSRVLYYILLEKLQEEPLASSS